MISNFLENLVRSSCGVVMLCFVLFSQTTHAAIPSADIVTIPLIATPSPVVEDIKLMTHDWWTSDRLHLVITVQGKMPDPSQDQAKYFLSFKNQWVIEAEGFINHKLKNHSLKIESMTAGESETNRNHTLDVHVVLKQVSDSKRDKACNIMAFIYTTNSPDKNIEKSCLDKLDEELQNFKKTWKPIIFFRGFIKNGDNRTTHRTHWEAVIGVK